MDYLTFERFVTFDYDNLENHHMQYKLIIITIILLKSDSPFASRWTWVIGMIGS